MNRRALLSIVAATVAGGCLDQGEQPPSLTGVWLANDASDRFEVDVTVEDEGELVFSDAVQLPPGEDRTTELRLTDVADGPGHYVVTATIGGERYEVDTVEASEPATDCVTVRYAILDDASVETRTEPASQC